MDPTAGLLVFFDYKTVEFWLTSDWLWSISEELWLMMLYIGKMSIPVCIREFWLIEVAKMALPGEVISF